jgi:exodeoxyribonuclease VII small subunit
MPSESAPEPQIPAPAFEANLAELDKIVRELEAGDLPLEKSLALYERGVLLTRTCRQQLEEAETRVEMLTKQRNGEFKPEPYTRPGT